MLPRESHLTVELWFRWWLTKFATCSAWCTAFGWNASWTVQITFEKPIQTRFIYVLCVYESYR